ncbi:uncharacterized protein [Argopecten irradians]|uniref:uncharacterized protein n=1 Tax=Argopecten irradians TaxID=31199 RepID=UPI0037108CC5
MILSFYRMSYLLVVCISLPVMGARRRSNIDVSSPSGDGIDAGGIVGIVFGVLFGIALLIFLFYCCCDIWESLVDCCCSKNKSSVEPAQTEDSNSEQDAPGTSTQPTVRLVYIGDNNVPVLLHVLSNTFVEPANTPQEKPAQSPMAPTNSPPEYTPAYSSTQSSVEPANPPPKYTPPDTSAQSSVKPSNPPSKSKPTNKSAKPTPKSVNVQSGYNKGIKRSK